MPSTGKMENSPFARLSPELRNRIWELSIKDFGPRYGVTIDIVNMHKFNGLTRTCRQTRAESRAMFYANNDFFVHVWNETDVASVCRILQEIGPEALSCLQRLWVDLQGRLKSCGCCVWTHDVEIRGWDTSLARGRVLTGSKPSPDIEVSDELWMEWLSQVLDTLQAMGLEVAEHRSDNTDTVTWFVGDRTSDQSTEG